MLLLYNFLKSKNQSTVNRSFTHLVCSVPSNPLPSICFQKIANSNGPAKNQNVKYPVYWNLLDPEFQQRVFPFTKFQLKLAVQDSNLFPVTFAAIFIDK